MVDADAIAPSGLRPLGYLTDLLAKSQHTRARTEGLLPPTSVVVRKASTERLSQIFALNGVTAAALADVDADGLNDLLVARDAMVSLYLNQGNGTLTPGPQIPALAGIDSLAVGVMDTAPSAWGKQDIAFATSTGQQVAVLLNQASY